MNNRTHRSSSAPELVFTPAQCQQLLGYSAVNKMLDDLKRNDAGQVELNTEVYARLLLSSVDNAREDAVYAVTCGQQLSSSSWNITS